MVLDPVLLFILFIQLRRILKRNNIHPDWQKLLFSGLFVIPVLFIVGQAIDAKDYFQWLWHVLLVLVMALIFYKEEFKGYRNFVYAFLPLVGLGILEDAVKIVQG